MSCEGCPYKGGSVGSRGPADAEVVIVGDGPTAIELAKGRPFQGLEMQFLKQALDQVGIDHTKILYMNAIECFANDKKTGNKKVVQNGEKVTIPGGKTKYKDAITRCSGRLHAEIGRYRRKLVIAMGAGALHGLTGDHKLKITQQRGGMIESELAEQGIFVSVHPTYILRGGGSLPQFIDDMKKVKLLIEDNAKPEYRDADYYVLKSKESVRALARHLRALGKKRALLGADIETGGFDFWRDETLCLGVTWNGKTTVVVPEGLITPELFENDCLWAWHNGKFDIKFLWVLGCWNARVDHDTMMMSYALDETKGRHDLEQVAWDWLGAPDYKDVLKPYLPNKQTSYRVIPKPVLYKYLGGDVGRTFHLVKPLMAKLKEDPQILKNYTRVLIPASNYLARVEWNGFKTDQEWVHKHRIEMEAEREKHHKKFQELAVQEWGKEVNVKSPKQIREYLYGHLKLAHIEKDTSRDTLERLDYNPCLEPLLRMRKLDKYLSTYVYPCINKIDLDERIHATYKIHGTVTGRLSSSGPNMQNIPRLKEVRGMFVAPKGRVILECDLSQAELRSLAQLSNDIELCRIYNSDEMSLHDEVTAEVFPEYTNPKSTPEEKLEMKMRGKAINFGIVYGRQAYSFVAEFGISVQEAQRWIDKWLNRFPEAKTFIHRCRSAVSEGLVLATVFGRKRRFGAITESRRRKMENEASNFPHQSTASDITLLAGIEIEPIVREKYNAKVVNTVHDCIVIECDPEDALAIARLVTSTMVRIPRDWGLTRVPFESEAELGTRWGHLEELHFKEEHV